jgi:hypothetical protein
LLCARPDHPLLLLPDTIFTTATAALPLYANTTVKSHRPPPLLIAPIILCVVVFIDDQWG